MNFLKHFSPTDGSVFPNENIKQRHLLAKCIWMRRQSFMIFWNLMANIFRKQWLSSTSRGHSKTKLTTYLPFLPSFLLIKIFSYTHSKHVELTTANQKTTEELTKIKGELVTKDKQLEITKIQTDKLKQLGRTLKSKNDQLNQELNR